MGKQAHFFHFRCRPPRCAFGRPGPTDCPSYFTIYRYKPKIAHLLLSCAEEKEYGHSLRISAIVTIFLGNCYGLVTYLSRVEDREAHREHLFGGGMLREKHEKTEKPGDAQYKDHTNGATECLSNFEQVHSFSEHLQCSFESLNLSSTVQRYNSVTLDLMVMV